MPDENGRARKQAINKYTFLVVMQGFLGAGLIVCGYLGAELETKFIDEKNSQRDFDDFFDREFATDGPPFYLGGFLIGGLQSLSALISLVISSKGTKAGRDDVSQHQKAEIACLMVLHFVLGFFSIPLGILSGLFATVISTEDFEDFSQSEDINNIKYAIVAGCGISVLLTFYAMYILNTSGEYFGVANARRHRVMFEQAMEAQVAMMNNPNTLQMAQLQAQNLGLQQQIMQQQGGPHPTLGSQYPPVQPPPSYGLATNSAFPPGHGNR